ncbi:hypothetical protein ACHAXS_008932 [Conticribra weissflogii]
MTTTMVFHHVQRRHRRNVAIATAALISSLLVGNHHVIPASSAFQRHFSPSASRPRRFLDGATTGPLPSSLSASLSLPSSPSVILPSDDWGNAAALSLAASLAQLLGRSTPVGRLLGAPVTAMALTFALASLPCIPSLSSLRTLLPPGGSPAASSLQSLSLALATPLLLLGTSFRGAALRRCRPSLAAFAVASLGTLLGAALPFLGAVLPSSGGDEFVKVAAALVAKNIGGGINYVAVCACLGASAEGAAAGLCADNVAALVYFPVVSLLASRWGDLDGEEREEGELEEKEKTEKGEAETEMEKDKVMAEKEVEEKEEKEERAEEEEERTEQEKQKRPRNDGTIAARDDDHRPVESLSHAIALAALLTAAGRWLDALLRRFLSTFSADGSSAVNQLNLSLPITTLLTLLFSTWYPPDLFLSTSTSRKNESTRPDEPPLCSNHIAKAGETLGTSLLYLFFATAGAPGWTLQHSVRRSLPSLAVFLTCLYAGHGLFLRSVKALVDALFRNRRPRKRKCDNHPFWSRATAPQRLLVASSAAIGGPATAAALAQSNRWDSLVAPGLLVGNVGYAIGTFVGLAFYGVFRVRVGY